MHYCLLMKAGRHAIRRTWQHASEHTAARPPLHQRPTSSTWPRALKRRSCHRVGQHASCLGPFIHDRRCRRHCHTSAPPQPTRTPARQWLTSLQRAAPLEPVQLAPPRQHVTQLRQFRCGIRTVVAQALQPVSSRGRAGQMGSAGRLQGGSWTGRQVCWHAPQEHAAGLQAWRGTHTQSAFMRLAMRCKPALKSAHCRSREG
jgi:hypothetical protein